MNPTDQLTKASEALLTISEALEPLDGYMRSKVLAFASEAMGIEGQMPVWGTIGIGKPKGPPAVGGTFKTATAHIVEPPKKKGRAKKTNGASKIDPDLSVTEKAIIRLVAKGFNETDSRHAIQKAIQELGKSAGVYPLLSHAEARLSAEGKKRFKTNYPPIDSPKVVETLDYIARKGPVNARDIAAWAGSSYANIQLRMKTLKVHDKVKLSPGTKDQYVAA